jgi:hypothetical protein
MAQAQKVLQVNLSNNLQVEALLSLTLCQGLHIPTGNKRRIVITGNNSASSWKAAY